MVYVWEEIDNICVDYPSFALLYISLGGHDSVGRSDIGTAAIGTGLECGVEFGFEDLVYCTLSYAVAHGEYGDGSLPAVAFVEEYVPGRQWVILAVE